MGNETAQSREQLIESFTRREREILVLLSGDKSNQEIADQLYLALSTVKGYIQQIYNKLGVGGRREAVHVARDLGLLEEGSPIPPRRHNLPAQLSSFIGRESEIEQVTALLGQHRLVTLTGSGGTGKTRLALAAAGQLLSQVPGNNFKAGIWLVELAPVTNPDLIPQTITSILGLQVEPDRPVIDILNHWLKNREIFLILDNCEHLVEACADLSKKLLQSAPGLKVLATSREALGVTGEIIFHVPSLSLPAPGQTISPDQLRQSESGRLFLERARTVFPNFEIDAHNVELVAQICKRLDGIPLAIELAAARLAVLDVQQIATRLDQSFRILSGSSRMFLERHRTLRATIEWSYDLLNQKERRLFQRLAVFVGGWVLEAAEAVCAGEDLESEEVFETLSQLVNKSMVQVERQPGRQTRYRMLEAIRQYASEKLSTSGESEALRRQHCTWFEKFVETGELKMRTREWLVWLEKFDAERDNLRAVLGWALDRSANPLSGARLANHLTDYWSTRGHVDEGYRWLEKSLEVINHHDPISLTLQVRTLNSMVILLDWWGKPAVAIQRLEKVLDLCENLGVEGRRERAEALIWLGWIEALHFGNLIKGLSLSKESEALYRELGPAAEWDLVTVLGGESYIYLYLNQLDEAQSCAEEGLRLARDMDGFTVSRSLTDLGNIAFRRGEFSQAREYFNNSLAIIQDAEDAIRTATIYRKLGTVENALGRPEQAGSLYQQALRIYADSIFLDNGTLQTIECMAINEISWASTGQTREHLLSGAHLMGLDERLRQELGIPIFLEIKLEFEQALAILQEQLDPDSLASAWAEGCAMTLEQAVESSGFRSAA